jgi:5-methylcytosine-specific restriction enzyme B
MNFLWKLMREGNCVAIGWEIGDLTEITNDKKGKEQIFQLLLDRDPKLNHAAAGRAAQQIFNFRCTMADNDLALASDGATVLGIGRVTDDYAYKYDPSSDFPHRRPVEWLSLDEWQQPDQKPDIEGKLTTSIK